MFLTRITVSALEFAMTVLMAILVVYFNFQVLGYMNKDYNEEDEINKNNLSVAILTAGKLVASGLMVQKGIYPVTSLARMYFLTPMSETMSLGRMALYALSHLVMSFAISAFTISFTLRLYGRLTVRIKEGEELKKGNVSVGIMLASVLVVVALYVSEGIGSLSKALIPQPSIGRVEIMR